VLKRKYQIAPSDAPSLLRLLAGAVFGTALIWLVQRYGFSAAEFGPERTLRFVAGALALFIAYPLLLKLLIALDPVFVKSRRRLMLEGFAANAFFLSAVSLFSDHWGWPLLGLTLIVAALMSLFYNPVRDWNRGQPMPRDFQP
jgi:hypothetical protein